MKVIIAIDNSETAERTFEWYCENFHKSSNKVVLVHLAPSPTISNVYLTQLSICEDELKIQIDEVKSKLRNLKRKFQEKAEALKVKVDFHMQIYEGSTGEGLLNTAEIKNAEAIFVGSRGLGLIRRTVLGSVSQHLVRNSKIPVVIYPAK